MSELVERLRDRGVCGNDHGDAKHLMLDAADHIEALEQEMDRWLLACAADESIVTPHEMGWLPDGTRRFPADVTTRASAWFNQHGDAT